MSGQGAMFEIDNHSAQDVSASCNGDGMNFIPPSGTLAAGAQRGPRHVEAELLGSSSFNLVLDGSVTSHKAASGALGAPIYQIL